MQCSWIVQLLSGKIEVNYIKGHLETTWTRFWLPTYLNVDNFYPKRGQKEAFFDHLPTSSCPRSFWTTPLGNLQQGRNRLQNIRFIMSQVSDLNLKIHKIQYGFKYILALEQHWFCLFLCFSDLHFCHGKIPILPSESTRFETSFYPAMFSFWHRFGHSSLVPWYKAKYSKLKAEHCRIKNSFKTRLAKQYSSQFIPQRLFYEIGQG